MEPQKSINSPYALMSVSKVYKRDGRLVDFDKSKIESALKRAFISTETSIADEDLKLIADTVVAEVMDRFVDKIPGVEEIQDIVEKRLAKSEYFKVAKSYILYREKHKELREEIVADVQDKVIYIRLSDGTLAPFNFKDVEIILRNNFGDMGSKAVMFEVLEDVQRSVFDGMEYKDLYRSIIMAVSSRIELDPDYSRIATRIVLNGLYKDILGQDEFTEGFEYAYRVTFEQKVRQGVAASRLDPRMLDFDFTALSQQIVCSRDKLLEYRGILMFADKYALKDPSQEIYELPQYFWMRVAMGLSLNEANKNQSVIEFYHTLSQLLYVPSSPTLYHAGFTHSQMSSCFLMTVLDDLDHIFKSYNDHAQLAKYAGGVGLDWTNVRSTGAMIKSTNVTSQGVIPFLKICDSTNAAINRSGRKRGAAVAYIEPWHFDIESFLELRRNVGDDRRRTHNINTALWIPDLFIKRVLSDEKWTLFSPDETPELHQLYGKAFESKYI
ncbi:ribonucleoside-diphosphate reductase subunit alpha, partial [Patescibacteria group bacterium]|nr:ribonucleoside-diphosphate reductase subunit alpha [Patescibacteria group bacterium]